MKQIDICVPLFKVEAVEWCQYLGPVFGHEVDFVLEQSGKLVALEIKTDNVVTGSDADGIRAFRDSLEKNQNLVRGVVLHAGQARPLDKVFLALPWRWMVPGVQAKPKLK